MSASTPSRGVTSFSTSEFAAGDDLLTRYARYSPSGDNKGFETLRFSDESGKSETRPAVKLPRLSRDQYVRPFVGLMNSMSPESWPHHIDLFSRISFHCSGTCTMFPCGIRLITSHSLFSRFSSESL